MSFTPQIYLQHLGSLGAAGIMGAMWLWERRTSRKREEQLSDAHRVILDERNKAGEFVQLIKENTAAIARVALHVETEISVLRDMLRVLERINKNGKE